MRGHMTTAVAVIAVIVLVVAMGVERANAQDVLLDENFDSYSPGGFPIGWDSVYGGAGWQYQVVTNDQSVSSPNSFTMLGSPSNSAVVDYDFASPPPDITYSGRVRVAAGAVTANIAAMSLWNKDEATWGMYYCQLRFGDTAIWLYASGVPAVHMQSYNREQWYHWKVEYDAVAKTASVWIDDVQVGTDEALSTGSLGYNALALSSEHGAKQCWYDDIYVTKPSLAPSNLTLDHVDGIGLTENQIVTGTDVRFHIRLTNDQSLSIHGLNHGFQVYSPDGASWRPITLDTANLGWLGLFNLGVFFNSFSVTGSGADTVGLSAYVITSSGFPPGYDEVILDIETEVYPANVGQHLCLDSAFFPPGGIWSWGMSGGGGTYIPSWDGPHCWEIVEISNNPPVITNNPFQLVFDHCDMAYYDFEAFDQEDDPYWFELLDGPGSINTPTGEWMYQPSLADVGYSQMLIVCACDEYGCGPEEYCDLIFTNEPPVFTAGCGVELYGYPGDIIYHLLEAEAIDCDPLTMTIVDVLPSPVGMYIIDGATGEFMFESDPSDQGTFTFTVAVDDGLEGDSCVFTVTMVTPGDIPGISFGQTDFYMDSLTLLNSDWGVMEVNAEELVSHFGFNDGFLNIYTDQGWVIDNLWLDTADGYGSIITYFQLLDTPGTDVTALTAHIEFTSEPIDSFTDGLRVSFPVLPDEVALGDGEDTVEVMAYIEPAPEPLLVVDSVGAPAKKNEVKRENVPNIQAAKSQCVPAAVSNSLQWLEDTYGIKVPHNHTKGLKGDNSLVGQLDKYMKRSVGEGTKPRRKGKGVNRKRMIDGKFEYLKKNGLTRKIIHKHQGTRTGGLPTGATYKKHGSTSKNESDDGYVTWEWIKQQIDNGEDVELCYWRYQGSTRKGGHCVMVVGWKKIRGRKYIHVAHDKKQTHRDWRDRKGCKVERIRVGGSKPLRYKTNSRRVVFALSESPDKDMDTIPDGLDNSVAYYNPNQEDYNNDGVGDVAQSPYLDFIQVGTHELPGAGSQSAFGPVLYVGPLDPDHKDFWFVGHVYNPHPTDSAQIAVAFIYRDESGEYLTSAFADTTEIPADTSFEFFGSFWLDACSDSIGVVFMAIDGPLVIDSGTFYSICYGVYTSCLGEIRGNVDYDPGDNIDISDLVYLVDYMFNQGPAPPCFEEADIDGSGEIDISDLVYLVDYMFMGGLPPVPCP